MKPLFEMVANGAGTLIDHGMIYFRRMLLLSVLVCIMTCRCSEPELNYDFDSYLAELHERGIDKYIGIKPERMEKIDAWEVYYYGDNSKAMCLDGTEYVVSLRRGDPSRVVLYLQGGGFCFDYDSCFGNKGYAKKNSGDKPGSNGFLNKDDSRNPLRNWSIVFAFYCDGSLWFGDNDVYYKDILTRHHGLANLSAAVTLLKDNFPSPEKILIAGSSAGGAGTLMGYFVTRTQFPELRLYVLNDSGAQLEDPENSYRHRSIRENWDFEQFFPDDCERCKEQLIFINDWALNYDKKVKFGLFSYYEDVILKVLSVSEFRDLLLETTDYIHNAHPHQFKRFFIVGFLHTILFTRTYYTEEIRGVHFYQWLDAMLNDKDDWKDLKQ